MDISVRAIPRLHMSLPPVFMTGADFDAVPDAKPAGTLGRGAPGAMVACAILARWLERR
jgi:hypothetical protein